MKAAFVLDTYFSRAPDGAVYSYGAFPYLLWAERFLPHFHSFTVIGREAPYNESHQLVRSDGPGVRFVLLENISSAMGLVFKSGSAKAKIREEIEQADAVIVRGPSELGMIAAQIVKLTSVNKPVAIEMSGCAFGHMWHHGSLTGKIYAPVKYWRARQMINSADAAIYVTKSFLQFRYPARTAIKLGTVANASNVEIEAPSSAVLEKRLQRIERGTPLTFGLIGNHGHKLKGLDIAIAALTRALGSLPPFEFRVLGNGPAENESFVRYDAPVSDKNAVMNWLDGVDVYLQPSRHEGLPRALIEAMSRGCPALGSNAGGIPELLAAENIHCVGDVGALTQQIIHSTNREWQKENAKRNFDTAQNYTRDKLLPVRKEFWSNFAAQARKARALEFARQAKHKDILVKI